MMDERPIEVWTSTAQMQVVGKRHYGRKAVAHGGGGGRAGARELFDTLAAVEGRVKLDAQGPGARRGAAQRFADELPDRRGRERRSQYFGTGPRQRARRRRT